MSDFNLIFTLRGGYDKPYYVIDEDLATLYTGNFTGTAGYYITVADRSDGVFYAFEPSGLLVKRSTADGSLIASTSAGTVVPIVIGGNDKLWTINYSWSNVLKEWETDLSSATTYTLKAGNALEDKIKCAAFTLDGNYVYLGGGSSNRGRMVAKYSMDNLDGGDPEWTKDIEDITYIFYMVVDEFDNLYVANYWSSYGVCRTFKLSTADGSFLWAGDGYVAGGGAISYCRERGTLFISEADYVSDWNSKYKQIDPSDGSLVNQTADCGAIADGCAVFDEDTIYCSSKGRWVVAGPPYTCSNNTKISKYAIDDDWEDGETPSDTLHVDDDYTVECSDHYWQGGDPTGYIHGLLTPTRYGLAGLAVDPIRKHILVCDTDNDAVLLKWLYGQEQITSKTAYGPSDAYSFSVPYDCCYSNGKYYVCDKLNHVVVKMDADSSLTSVNYYGTMGTAHNGDEHLNRPMGICSDGKYIYISDTTNDRIVKVEQNTLTYDSASSVSLDAPMGIEYDPTNKRLHICDSGNNRIVVIEASDLSSVTTYGSAGTGDGEFDTPTDITNVKSNMHVVDQGNNRVQAFELDGTFIEEIDGEESGDTDGLTTPNGIAYYSDSILITEDDNSSINTWYPYFADTTDNSWTDETRQNEGIDWDKRRDDQIDSVWTEESETDSTWTEES